MAGIASLALLLVSFSWIGLAVGLALCFSASLEIKGSRLIREGQPVRGLEWAAWSQVAVFTCLLAYSSVQLWRLEHVDLAAMLSPESRQLVMDLYQIDETVLRELLSIGASVTYVAVIVGSFLYQGGLWLFYGVNRRRLQ